MSIANTATDAAGPVNSFYFTVQKIHGGDFAECTYYFDPECKKPVGGDDLVVTRGQTTATLIQVPTGSDPSLQFWATVAKTIGLTQGLPFFTPASASVLRINGENQPIASALVQLPAVPEGGVRGVTLLFMDTTTGHLVPTSDPQVRNDDS